MRRPEDRVIVRPVYPVVLCGGPGERLWPLSRPWRPKPFIPLIGSVSGLQNAVALAQSLATKAEVIVVGVEHHRDLIHRQFAATAGPARVLLEPAARDTAASIAAAAVWLAGGAPDSVMVVLPADHHMPDTQAVRAALETAIQAAHAEVLVVMGLRPGSASTAFGYIRPDSVIPGIQPVVGFEEKPSAGRASELVAQGALWNSGIFVGRADTFVSELRRWAPEIMSVVEQAVLGGRHDGTDFIFGPQFIPVPRLAFDRAVMENTDRAVVLPVDFAWSDLGSWASILAASVQDADGNHVAPHVRATSTDRTLVRAPASTQVSVVGLSNVAVVVEPDAVLVCALDETQVVRGAGDGPLRPDRYTDLAEAAEDLGLWLRTAALPLWATVGMDGGAFREALTWRGDPADPYRRTLVQARQTFVFASAAAGGIEGPWGQAAVGAVGFTPRRADCLYVRRFDRSGAVVDPEARLYDNAFVLLARAALQQLMPTPENLAAALDLCDALNVFRHTAGGFREVGEGGFQANANMHLLEAALEWEIAADGTGWSNLSDELAELALARFVDPATGALSEYYDASWRRLSGDAVVIEPGHQFEWAWLLTRWGRMRQDPRGEAAARRLFDVGRRAFDPRRGVVVNALWADMSVRDAGARLWPQTEHIKAALILGDDQAALQAANGLVAYLETPARGVWRERMRPDGGFVEEPSPASSLYHLFLAIRELTRYAEIL